MADAAVVSMLLLLRQFQLSSARIYDIQYTMGTNKADRSIQ